MAVRNSFGELLRRERVRMGWKQEELAAKLYPAVSRQTVVRWEKDKLQPSLYNRKQLVDILGLEEEDADVLYQVAVQAPSEIETVELNEKEGSALYQTAEQVPPEAGDSASAQVPPITDPIIDNLPFRRNPFFTGRETELFQLHKRLRETGTVAITQAVSISGLGGVGKTELALEYAHRHYPNVYRTVLWVRAESAETLQTSYDQLTQLLNLPEQDAQEPDKRIQAVKQWLTGHRSWLLIMDNADDLPLANSFLPSQPLGHVIFTTRSQLGSDSDIAVQIMVEKMEPEKGLEFLLRRSGMVQNKANLDAARQVVKLLGGLPLALDQAGAYIKGTGTTFTDYLKRFREQRRHLLSKRRLAGGKFSEHTRHPESVAVTFELIFQKLRQEHSLAADILSFCAYLYPDAIPEELFEHDESFKPSTVDFDDAIAVLQRYSLIKHNTRRQTFLIHRLVQAVFIDTMSTDLQKQWRERVVRTVVAALPEDLMEWIRRPGTLAEQALTCIASIDDEIAPTLEVAELCNRVSVYYDYVFGPWEHALIETLMMRAIAIYRQHFGDERPYTSILLGYLTGLYGEQSKCEQIDESYRLALSSRERLLGAEHPDTQFTRQHYAYFLQKQGRDAEAAALEVNNDPSE